MKNYSQQFEGGIREAGVLSTKMPCSAAASLRNTVESRFASAGDSSPLWERLNETVSGKREDGWLLACEYAKEKEAIVFFDLREAEEMWVFQSGSELSVALNSSPALEFYITDRQGSFLICHNHHDFLIGTGSCVEWLRKKLSLT